MLAFGDSTGAGSLDYADAVASRSKLLLVRCYEHGRLHHCNCSPCIRQSMASAAVALHPIAVLIVDVDAPRPRRRTPDEQTTRRILFHDQVREELCTRVEINMNKF